MLSLKLILQKLLFETLNFIKYKPANRILRVCKIFIRIFLKVLCFLQLNKIVYLILPV